MLSAEASESQDQVHTCILPMHEHAETLGCVTAEL